MSDYFAGQVIRLETSRIQSMYLAANAVVVIGRLYQPNASGYMDAFDGTDIGKGVWQALESKDNTGGADKALQAQFMDVLHSEIVLNIATGINPGAEIKWDNTNHRGVATVLGGGTPDDRTKVTIGIFRRQPGIKYPVATSADDELAIVAGGT